MNSEFVTSSANPAAFPREGLPEVAFLGRSNVGKSSLINSLTGHKKLAFTSGTPGPTVATASYGVAGEVLGLTYDGYHETRTYNNRCN